MLPSLPLQLTLWIDEKILTAQDVSYDEARNLHSKWLKHQAFMAELASHQGWLEKLDEVGDLPRGLGEHLPRPCRASGTWRSAGTRRLAQAGQLMG